MASFNYGFVTQVISGSCVEVINTYNKGYTKKLLYLSDVITPRMGKNEEPYGFECREFLRHKVIGSKVKFKINHTQNDRNYAEIYVLDANGELDLSLFLVNEAMASIKMKNVDKNSKSEMIRIEKINQENHKGIYSQHVPSRHVVSTLSPNDDIELIEVMKTKGIEAIIEYLHDIHYYRISFYYNTKYYYLNVYLCAVQPINREEYLSFYQDSMDFGYFYFLHRDVHITLQGFDKNQNIFVTIKHPNGDMSSCLLKFGLATLCEWTCSYTSPTLQKHYHSLYQTAQSSKTGIYQHLTTISSTSTISSLSSEQMNSAVIISVLSGDTYQIQSSTSDLKSPIEETISISLASIHSPSMDRPDYPGEPLHFSSREYARKKLIGQQNFANLLLKEGYANVMSVSPNSPHSNEYHQYLQSETEAKNKKKGIWKPKINDDLPFTNLLSNPIHSRTQSFYSMISRNELHPAIVEHIFQSGRLLIRLMDERCLIPFYFHGIQLVTDQTSLISYLTSHILQRNMMIHIDHLDKKDNWHGILYYHNSNLKSSENNHNVICDLLKEGYALIDEKNKNYLSKHLIDEYTSHQNNAKQQQKGLHNLQTSQSIDLSIKSEQDLFSNRYLYQSISVLPISALSGTKFTAHDVRDENIYQSLSEMINKIIASSNQDQNNLDDLSDLSISNSPKTSDPGNYTFRRSGYRKKQNGIFKYEQNYYRGKILTIKKIEIGLYTLSIYLYDAGYTVSIDNPPFIPLPTSLSFSAYPPLALHCRLVLCVSPSHQSGFAETSRLSLENLLHQHPITVFVNSFQYLHDIKYLTVTVYQDISSVPEDNRTPLNSYLIRQGFIRLLPAQRVPPELLPLYHQYQPLIEASQKEALNIWRYGNVSDVETDDDMFLN